MTRSQKHALFFLVLAIVLGHFYDDKMTPIQVSGTEKIIFPQHSKNVVMGPKKLMTREPASYAKHVPDSTPQWKDKLEATLFTQGKGTLKKAEIIKVDSFPWKLGQLNVEVDSIIVKLEDIQGRHSSFRAIVDSSNGKILQTWDPPTIDNFDPKNKFGVKIDSRYHQD